jgi:hypothetical protein
MVSELEPVFVELVPVVPGVVDEVVLGLSWSLRPSCPFQSFALRPAKCRRERPDQCLLVSPG